MLRSVNYDESESSFFWREMSTYNRDSTSEVEEFHWSIGDIFVYYKLTVIFWSAFFPYFTAFQLNTKRYGVSECGKNADQNNSEYGHFLRSAIRTFSDILG